LNIKDNFSAIAASYASWRPEYPEALFTFLASLTKEHNAALDCGTGNGQAAKHLAAYYKQVQATDISAAQLQHAVVMPNIQYSISPAEKTIFPGNYFDIICAAQAAHWFNHDIFYNEAERILKPGGIIAFIGYALIEVNKNVDEVIHILYKDILGEYWDKERRYIDDHYQSLPFPYTAITIPQFEINCEWNLPQLLGYLSTWSALNHFKKINKHDPLQQLLPALQKAWGSDDLIKTIHFPIISKIAAARKDSFKNKL
jgi:ubiquinone/menaquinone biosynthesis C-methylase UbiE